MRVATRGSALALIQAGTVADAIGDSELVVAPSGGAEPNDKARWVHGVERMLLNKQAELGVHSAKDLPGELAEGLALVGVPVREDPADAFIGEASSIADLPEGARIGTASLRRRSQLLSLRSDLEILELRGNVDTRLRKLADGELHGIVLAAAGLNRLGRGGEISFRFGANEMVPAPGQGSLAIEAHARNTKAAEAAAALTDREALIELTAERAAVAALGATCDTPVGLLARHIGDELAVAGYAGMPDGSEFVRDALRGDPTQPAALGEALAARMIAAGASEILARAEAQVAP